MAMLVLGLILFLGIHSVRIVGDSQRSALVQRLGANGYKGLYTVVSALGLTLIVWGYSLARHDPIALWAPIAWARHLASLLTLVAFVLVIAAYVPGNGIKARLHHPMVLGVKVWALAHLLANHTLADVLLFGGFLLWAALSFRAARVRDRAAATVYPAGRASMTALTIAVGALLWAAFAIWAHPALIGVAVFGSR